MNKLIATSDEGRYVLIQNGSDTGFIADTQARIRYDSLPLISVDKFGQEWEDAEDDPALVKRVLGFKLVAPTENPSAIVDMDMAKASRLDSTAMQRIIVDVTLGRPASKNETVEERAFRLRVTPEIEEAKAKGLMIDFTPEMPFID